MVQGLGLLLMSSSKDGMKKLAAFYVSLSLLATGIAGRATMRESFEEKLRVAGQATTHESVEEKLRVADQATTPELSEEKPRVHCNSMCNKCEEFWCKVGEGVVRYGVKVCAFLIV
ncbi:hypothetical protein Ancab_039759 [Ancistrocladus abbreviatus]